MLAKCLDSILAMPSNLKIEIVVVDSASSDNTVETIKTRYPQVKLLPQGENIGYTRSNNVGLKAAEGRHLLLLNPDTEIIGDALDAMVGYLDSQADVGIVGPHTLNSDGTTQSTKRRFPTMGVGFFEGTWLQPFAPKSLLDHYYTSDVADKSTQDVDWVQGSALMTRRTVYEEIGGLDEGYVMFSEEVDFCRRAKAAGWRVVYLGTAQITHHGGKSTEQVAARKHIYFHESRLRYFRKYHGWTAAQCLRLFLLCNYAWQIGLEKTKSILGSKPTMRRERIDAYWQVLRSGLKVR
jgi:N-acetylglucosaminyl-diphospho-decaprenol L-rhamnosyltransferase